MASRRSLFVMLTSFSSTLMTSWMMSSMSSMMVTITKITLFNQKYPLSQIMLHHDQHDQHKTQVILLLQCLSPRSSSSHSSSMTIVNSKILSMDGDYRSSFLSSVFSHHHQVKIRNFPWFSQMAITRPHVRLHVYQVLVCQLCTFPIEVVDENGSR